MNNTVSHLRELASSLRLSNLKNNADEIVLEAEQDQMGPVKFLELVLQQELDGRLEKACKRRMKESHLPALKTLDDFDVKRLENFSAEKLERLTRFDWIEDHFNLFLTGHPGTGKTHLACALGVEAVEQGYSTSFATMPDMLEILKNQTFHDRSRRRVERIKASRLFIIDGVGDFPLTTLESNLFLQLLNQLHETCSILLTANHGTENWPEVFDNNSQLLGSLDRLLYKCEVIKLEAKSYRVEHRQSILPD